MNAAVSPSAADELNLLLEWPEARTRPQWAAIFGSSIALHILFFFAAVRIPTLVGREQPAPVLHVQHVTLYLPKELMTQKAPNRAPVSKQIDLADLMSSREAANRGAEARRPSVKRFELPKQDEPKPVAKNTPPQILPEAPKVDSTGNAPAAGIAGGLPVPPPPAPKPSESPFQNVGSAVPPNPHPTLAPPKSAVNAPVDGLVQSQNNRELVISDDVPQQSAPGSLGTNAQAPAQHAAVELQSDPTGADFRAYLRQILLIVRTNWRRVVPESARMGMLKGRTVVEFAINRDGSIPKMVVADTSGSMPLDRAAVAGLSMSNPLPPLPADYRGMQVRLAFTFAYNLPAK
ncbi:MAG TPA: TonB family protein [Bryobacteraceae bacterium]|nr:TonB family protein [Bryobacteraceae bacterium]